MTLVRKAVTLEADLAEAAQAIAPGGNFSALVAEALDDRVRAERLRRLLDEDEAERGRIPAHVLDAVAAEMHDVGA
ncbi:MAG: type II toxin-antitoxin system CcdA family antitoxin [Solirubrobacteraceae bacterium]|nr:type II toxin-antitoxin system CcdA family antitoxin [Solirubrobacteraceae bacterium]